MSASEAGATPSTLRFDRPPAVVVGACGHGLAVIRALAAGGVPVLALEANPEQPGARSSLATVIWVDDINGEGLVHALRELRGRIACPGMPVLFLTNDRMVRTLGRHWDALAGQYALSWAEGRERLLPLLDKPALEARCRETGLNYPATFVLRSPAEAAEAGGRIGFPMLVKPARPLSRFKTTQPASSDALRAWAERYADDLPFLVQQFIPGDDTHIHFSALYLDRGKVLARFDGRKLRSRPLGHTTIAESLRDDAVYADTLRFFEGLELSGPVSLELKRDAEGVRWVIEPTLGRTDFWVGLCIANGVNLPLVEYQHQCGLPVAPPAQRNEAVWYNEDRDPLGRWWTGRQGLHASRRSAFVFLSRQDPEPALLFLRQASRRLMASAARRLRLGAA